MWSVVKGLAAIGAVLCAAIVASTFVPDGPAVPEWLVSVSMIHALLLGLAFAVLDRRETGRWTAPQFPSSPRWVRVITGAITLGCVALAVHTIVTAQPIDDTESYGPRLTTAIALAMHVNLLALLMIRRPAAARR
ncbi:hypothetical protein ACFWN2_28405 [Lentzea sp. NPDC058436]|uniref:hypothetical protein n=1 Tax=Lentzea sp. NPDC058436 TaxID=3346499 RepID=UPI00365864BB